jgi:UDP-N-acetylglucosamine diphosphorylase/glucosamine-1-phosphate N-acetyltransferase
MNYILFDDTTRNNLFPLTFTRPVADIRFGILTIREKWEMFLQTKTSTLTENYLSIKYPIIKKENNVLINGSVCPNKQLIKQIKALKPNQALIHDNYIIALYTTADNTEYKEENIKTEFVKDNSEIIEDIETKIPHLKINYLWDIFVKNEQAIIEDYDVITKNRKSQTISNTNKIIGNQNIFVEQGAKIECAILNASEGPIYIGRDAEIMESSTIRGPFALCEHSVVKIGAKIYGPTTIGPYSKIGGELNNSVIIGYSNKAHDGFIGNSVIGEWCNLGAGTNNSNLKNNYTDVKLWSYKKQKFVTTELQFCGLIMGDHSKCGINTMFNTGTVVGINANIYGSGFQKNFIPSFSWGGTDKFTTYNINTAINVAEKVFKRRNKIFDHIEKNILKHLYDLTFKFRADKILY